MTLSRGHRLGPYEILDPLGAGGMGEVYLARDTRLERTVAIKILSAHLSDKPGARERFEREAKIISSLNHPHVCRLFDVGSQDGVAFLVMEYLEGETLAQRLRKGALPLEQVLRLGMEICEGLEQAHRSGVVHRDLKPGNVMLTKSGVRLMDFGLAKPVAPLGEASSIETRGQALTEEGVVMGSFQYMSPEQVEGRDVDTRSDIFSLGAVLYEMTCGKRAFDGKSPLSVASAILEKEPEPLAARSPAPPPFEHAIRTCMAKDPEKRWQTARDLAHQLEWIARDGSRAGAATPAVARGASRERLAWGLFALLLLAGLVYAVAGRRVASSPRQARHFSAALSVTSRDLALTEDGKLLAFVAAEPSLGRNVIWVHEVGSRTARPLGDTIGASYPFWSPDGRFIGFFADGKLKKIDVARATVQVIADARTGRGGTWNRDGVIVFSPDANTTGLYRVSASGGVATPFTKLDGTTGETSHRWPCFLPDGKHLLYLAANFGGKSEANAIYLGALDSDERKMLVQAASSVGYAPGYILYVRNGELVAHPFDADRGEILGAPIPLSVPIARVGTVAHAAFSVSQTGTLVYQGSSAAGYANLTWFDRAGRKLSTLGDARESSNPRLSPDGKRVAVDIVDGLGNIDIWTMDSESGNLERFTFDPALEALPVWSPDASSIVFFSLKGGPGNLYEKPVGGSGSIELRLAFARRVQTNDWSPDGRFVIFSALRTETGWDLLLLPKEGEGKPIPFLESKFDEREGQFSPSGRWVAYTSDETGRTEVYVTSYSGGSVGSSGKWQVSSAGGSQPRWRRDGKEIFYLTPDNKLMVRAVGLAKSLELGPAIEQFQTRPREFVSALDVYTYDVSPDGQRILVNSALESAAPSPISVVIDWAAELERR
ncbi:MAG: serine/threonine-protein kinase [Acidobacteria bacterium]|nr:serine/threonine-protein kinase [Acidobacteriota bacterium]